jgi:hypothetical protein
MKLEVKKDATIDIANGNDLWRYQMSVEKATFAHHNWRIQVMAAQDISAALDGFRAKEMLGTEQSNELGRRWRYNVDVVTNSIPNPR